MDRYHGQSQWWTRRDFLGVAAGTVAGVYGLSLGGPGEVPRVFAAQDFKLRAPEPQAKRGGVLRYGVHNARRTSTFTSQERCRTWACKAACTTT